MKKVRLTSGNYALCDDEDYEMLMKYEWAETTPGHRRTTYARSGFTESGKTRTVRMHRLVLGLQYRDGKTVDHVNGDGLDNRKENLRECGSAQNSMNVGVYRNNISGYKGVYYRKERDRWVAGIRYNGKYTKLKSCKCKHAAAYYYNKKAKELFKEFVWLNEIEECGCVECDNAKQGED